MVNGNSPKLPIWVKNIHPEVYYRSFPNINSEDFKFVSRIAEKYNLNHGDPYKLFEGVYYGLLYNKNVDDPDLIKAREIIFKYRPLDSEIPSIIKERDPDSYSKFFTQGATPEPKETELDKAFAVPDHMKERLKEPYEQKLQDDMEILKKAYEYSKTPNQKSQFKPRLKPRLE